ncbi:MAG: (2Fe-2S)-binding protein, partial [Anaerolineales bacterium]|nr:(2Fe-2S)-binding protein [Anaerolineales bacterium]
MARQTNLQINNRLSPQSNELIDRTQTIYFRFNGKEYAAHPGDTIASALAANGVSVLARSFKYHRPRGLMDFGHAMNALVQIGNEPSVNVWTRRVEEGMEVQPVNAWPSL